MSILSGFKKYKDYIKTSSGYQLASRWTSSDTVEMKNGKTLTNNIDTTLTVSGSFADAKTVGDKIKTVENKLTASDSTPFRFGVTSDGKYGYIVTDGSGADTVIPFSSAEGDAASLYQALQYSGLVTEDMTYEEMLEVLAAEYPSYLDILLDPASDYTYSSSGSVSSNGISITSEGYLNMHGQGANWTSNWAYVYWTKNTLVDLTKYSKIKVQGTFTQSATDAWFKLTLLDGTTGTEVLSQNITAGNFDQEIDISTLSGTHTIKFSGYVAENRSVNITFKEFKAMV